MTLYENFFKRVLDCLVALIAIVMLIPVFVIVATLIRLNDGGTVIYSQDRLGKNGKTFRIFKFRSMTDRMTRNPGEAGELTTNHPEITAVGRWIRRTKIDELPQLFSVLLGAMSLIGPRPCLPEQIREFDGNGFKRLRVRPGCSGLAQVYGNIHLSWPERWRYDAYYADNVSFYMDVKILYRTLLLLIRGEHLMVVPFDDFYKKVGKRND